MSLGHPAGVPAIMPLSVNLSRVINSKPLAHRQVDFCLSRRMFQGHPAGVPGIFLELTCPSFSLSAQWALWVYGSKLYKCLFLAESSQPRRQGRQRAFKGNAFFLLRFGVALSRFKKFSEVDLVATDLCFNICHDPLSGLLVELWWPSPSPFVRVFRGQPRGIAPCNLNSSSPHATEANSRPIE